MTANDTLAPMSLDAYLDQYRNRELLRFLTCGSVDDGKSTLIGRLLHDTHGIYEDQLVTARRDSARHGTQGGELDLALLVDGLQAEREQGITIDVAYRYFATPRRKFIIADTPGHEQYTRNMATGASTCDLAVILIDATRGVLDQTRRHSFIAALLGIKHLVVAINKMDLVDFSEAVFDRIRADFTQFAAKLQVTDVQFIPLAALSGDNVVHRSERMEWYQGSPLLDYLETVHIASDRNLIDLRFPVQLVSRPNAEFRGYSGTIASGVVRVGDSVVVLPSGKKTRVRAILTPAGERGEAFSPTPITLAVEDEIDASRGDMFVHSGNVPRLENAFEAMVVWMQEDALTRGREYLLKQTTVLTPAVVTEVRYRMNVNTLHREHAPQLGLNDIGRIRIETPRLLAFDSYSSNRATGAFILIDRITNATVAAGMILDRDPAEVVLSRSGVRPEGAPAAESSSKRLGQAPLAVTLEGSGATGAATALAATLSSEGFIAELLDPAELSEPLLTEVQRRLYRIGIITIVPRESGAPLSVVASSENVSAEPVRLETTDAAAADEIQSLLRRAGVLRRVG